jgi:hypothetical protein
LWCLRPQLQVVVVVVAAAAYDDDLFVCVMKHSRVQFFCWYVSLNRAKLRLENTLSRNVFYGVCGGKFRPVLLRISCPILQYCHLGMTEANASSLPVFLSKEGMNRSFVDRR